MCISNISSTLFHRWASSTLYYKHLQSLLSSPGKEKIENIWHQELGFQLPTWSYSGVGNKGSFLIRFLRSHSDVNSDHKGNLLSQCHHQLKGCKFLPHHSIPPPSWEHHISCSLFHHCLRIQESLSTGASILGSGHSWWFPLHSYLMFWYFDWN